MKNNTLTITEFEALVANAGWTHEVDVVDASYGTNRDADQTRGGVFVVTSKLGDITIKYEESYSYKLTDIESFDVSTEGQSDVFTFENVTIVDEAGDEMDKNDLNDCFTDKSDSTQLTGSEGALMEFMPFEFMDFSSERDALEKQAVEEIQAALEEQEELED